MVFSFLWFLDIILQQANTTFATSTPISSFSLKTSGTGKGERNVVVLQQQHQNPVPIVPVRSFSQNHNNRLPPAPPSIAAAANSSNFSPNTTSSSVRASRSTSMNSTGVGFHFFNKSCSFRLRI